MSSRDTIDSTDAFASSYDEYIRNCNWVGPDILFGLMAEYLLPGESLLDIGIGTGLGVRLFKQFGLEIYGVDGSEQMLKICREKGISGHLVQADLSTNTPWFKDTRFCFMISHAVFHLVGDLNAVFGRVSRQLKNQGCFAFTFEIGHAPDDNYKETGTKGLFVKHNTPAGILSYRHTENYMLELIRFHGLSLLKKTEFLAFVDPASGTRTFFAAWVVQHLGIK